MISFPLANSGFSTSRRPIVVSISIPANARNVNLRTLYTNAGYSSMRPAIVTFTTTGLVGSNNTSTPAIITGTGWRSGSQLTLVCNHGVAGCGGPPGGDPGCPAAGIRNSAGGPGGNAIELQYPMTIINNSIIGGGGTGGTTTHGFYITSISCGGNGCRLMTGPNGAGIDGYWDGAGGGAPANQIVGCGISSGAGGVLGSSGAALKTNGNTYILQGNAFFGSVTVIT